MKKSWVLIIAVIALVVLNWGSMKDMFESSGVKDKITGGAIIEIPEESNSSIDLYFCPVDDCEGELIKTIEMASKKLHCAFYDVDLTGVKNALIPVKEKGVDVKLVVDADNFEFFEELDWAMPDDRSAIMHNKFCIVDDTIVWTGSVNPTYRGTKKNNNNALRIKSVELAANYEDEFDEMWNGGFGRGPEVEEPIIVLDGMRVENYFCPEDWCANKVLKILEGANKSIDFMTFSFTHDELGDAVIDKFESGIKVRGVFEKSQNNKYNEYSKMVAEGMDVTWDGNGANMHHKVFIVDRSIVVTGSFNPSKNGDTRNDENVLIIYDSSIAERYLKEFERVLEEANINGK